MYMALKLKDTHPFAEKMATLFSAMSALNISIEVGSQRTIVIDNSTGDRYILADVDGEGINNNMTEFPCPCEYKLIVAE
jgi:hypothetical protein